MDIQPVVPAAPIRKSIKISRDEHKQDKRPANHPNSEKKEQQDSDNDDVQHIDEVV